MPPARTESPTANGQRRKRALSTLTNLAMPGRMLTKSHPVLSIPRYIELFGPLLFPLHRLALLRRRILLVTQPPVQQACEFGLCSLLMWHCLVLTNLVYDISVLSTISSALAEQLPPESSQFMRLSPLFTVGVHDIPTLSSKQDDPEGWVACTTDEILSMKKDLYDYVVELPSNGTQRWPRIKNSSGAEVRATHRDLRRWRFLRRALHRSSQQPRYTDDDDTDRAIDDDADEGTGLLMPGSFDDPDSDRYDAVVEPTSWSALAYSGFIWWASAGERDAALDQEEEQDAVLNGDLEHAPPAPEPHQYRDEPDADDDSPEQNSPETDSTLHMELLAYFHRYSHQIFSGAASVIDTEASAGDESDAEGDVEVIIGEDDLRRMGLDGWSEKDREFVVDMMAMYFGKRAVVHGAGIDCCGIRIC